MGLLSGDGRVVRNGAITLLILSAVAATASATRQDRTSNNSSVGNVDCPISIPKEFSGRAVSSDESAVARSDLDC
jgi:hypothetical protein